MNSYVPTPPEPPVPQPTVHIRLHAEYVASAKGIVPDVTVTVNAPIPFLAEELARDIIRARIAASDEFERALQEVVEAIAHATGGE